MAVRVRSDPPFTPNAANNGTALWQKNVDLLLYPEREALIFVGLRLVWDEKYLKKGLSGVLPVKVLKAMTN